jgi:hypothetical protein
MRLLKHYFWTIDRRQTTTLPSAPLRAEGFFVFA